MSLSAHTTERATLLVVDDTPDNLVLISSLLKPYYQVKLANGGQKALDLLDGGLRPDLILLDVMMPEVDGYSVCRRIKDNAALRDVPVIFLTALQDSENEEFGLALGAVDYITKPVNPPILQARVQTHLKLKQAADFLRNQNDYLETEVLRRTREITAIQDVTILSMASLAETRDNETGNHIRRTQHYVLALARHLRIHPRYSEVLSDAYIDTLFKSAPLHDIGKVGIPDRILLKPGKLTADEFEIMKTHTTLGSEAIARAEAQLGSEVGFLGVAKEIARSHQEKWNGSGYPDGLAGEDIPLSARLMAIADVYDALISKRVYKSAMPHEKAVTILQEGRGSHFDPDLLDGFLAIQHEFQSIAARYADDELSLQEKADYLERALGEHP